MICFFVLELNIVFLLYFVPRFFVVFFNICFMSLANFKGFYIDVDSSKQAKRNSRLTLKVFWIDVFFSFFFSFFFSAIITNIP